MLGFAPIATLPIAASRTTFSVVDDLAISTFAVSSPTFGPVALTQKQTLAIVSFSAGSPTAGTVTLAGKQTFGLLAFNTGSPTFGPVALTGKHQLTVAAFNTSAPTFGPVSLNAATALGINTVSVGSPTFGPVSLTGKNSLQIANFVTNSPTFDLSITQVEIFASFSFSVGPLDSLIVPLTINGPPPVLIFEVKAEEVAHADYEYDVMIAADYEQITISADLELEEAA